MNNDGFPVATIAMGLCYALTLYVLITSLVDLHYRQFPDAGEKVAWLIAMLLGSWVGMLAYLAIGRKRGHRVPRMTRWRREP
ncbi:MAG: PLD nuclease N-terminal domain-containing protein [Armatimonadota bacterium]